MKIMMDAKDEFHRSFMVDDDDDDDVLKAGGNSKMVLEEGVEEESIPEGSSKSNSNFTATCSESSSFRDLEKLCGEGGEEEDVMDYGARARGAAEKEGLQKTEEDADDEYSYDGVTDGSRSDASSFGTTATSSGSTIPGKSVDSSGGSGKKKSCCLPALRFFGFWLLLAGTVFVGMEMVRYASQRYDDQLEEEFHDLALELILTAQHHHQAVLDAMKTMSLTAAAVSADQTWPFVTLPEFELWANRFSIGAKAVTLVVLAEEGDREAWNEYSQMHFYEWAVSGDPLNKFVPYVWKASDDFGSSTSLPTSYSGLTPSDIVEDKWEGLAAITWQTTTPFDPQTTNFNQFSKPAFKTMYDRMNVTGQPVVWSTAEMTSSNFLIQPITVNETEVISYLLAQISLLSYFSGGLHLGAAETPGIVLVVKNVCQGHAVELDLYSGREPQPVDMTRLTHLVFNSEFEMEAPLMPSDVDEEDACAMPIVLQVFATNRFVGVDGSAAMRMEPPKLAIATGIFVVLLGTICFLLYDFLVRRQQEKLAKSAKRSLAIVNALFPATVRDRLLEKEDTSGYPDGSGAHKRGITSGKKATAQSYRIQNRISTVFQSMTESMAMGNESCSEDISASGGLIAVPTTPSSLRRRMASKPIADLFPEASVLFADIAGFTAWSSVREPSQVFTLLESIFENFDSIAKRMKVFKVETIGDCYVAAAGVPEPCGDHAIKMCNFARKVLQRMSGVVRLLETDLGPGTADLSMRIGIHSGPIMAGVLRGEKTRFQLFGDTMNTTARIEASGEKDRIHLSQQTAELLIKAGKEDWVEARDMLVTAKGKGELQTYWLTNKSTSGTRCDAHGPKPSSMPELIVSMQVMRRRMSLPTAGDGDIPHNPTRMSPSTQSSFKRDQMERLIDFNTQVLERFLKKMIAMRQENAATNQATSQDDAEDSMLVPTGISTAGSVFDEVQEAIALPTEPAKYMQDPERVVLSPAVKAQLRDFVGAIASMYRDVPFHSFDHASHVVMSVTKLLSRVVTPESIDYRDMCYKIKAGSESLHEYTYGIQSDPLTHFAVAFAALCHDVDHQGLPNAQLVKERTDLAKTYNDKSVAEQHSIHLAWDLLMSERFKDLRACIYTSQAELDRFRALLVNSIMSTDIADKALADLRRRRWEKVFGVDESEGTAAAAAGDQESTNRKATIVIEHLIQASDVAHTMQHWHVYLRWNKRLFKECYLAYYSGHADKDPLESWYEGELAFFDNYIIPLAKKLKECGVFGVASDEYLNYAVLNRSEWASKGKGIVEDYREEFVAALGTPKCANKRLERKSSAPPPSPSPPVGRGNLKRQASMSLKRLPSTKCFPSWAKNLSST